MDLEFSFYFKNGVNKKLKIKFYFVKIKHSFNIKKLKNNF